MVIGAVLIPGAAAPKLVRRADFADDEARRGVWSMSPSTRAAASRPRKATTHADPIYDVDGIMHYCVANMPGAVARTSTLALGNATMPFMLALADKGWKQACADDPHLMAGLNVHAGKLTYAAVGEAQGLDVTDAGALLKAA